MTFESPLVQAGIVVAVVVGAIMTLKPAMFYDAAGNLKDPSKTPVKAGLLAGALWLAYQGLVMGKQILPAGLSSGGSGSEIAPARASIGAEIAATAQAGVAAGETFFE